MPVCVRLGLATAMVIAGVGSVAAASDTSPAGAANPVNQSLKPKQALKLNDQQRRQIVQAVEHKDTAQAPPAGFQVAAGSKVPSQKKLNLHPMPRPLIYQTPVLRQYDYALLTHNVLVVDPMSRKVVEVIPR